MMRVEGAVTLVELANVKDGDDDHDDTDHDHDDGNQQKSHKSAVVPLC